MEYKIESGEGISEALGIKNPIKITYYKTATNEVGEEIKIIDRQEISSIENMEQSIVHKEEKKDAIQLEIDEEKAKLAEAITISKADELIQ